MQTRLRRSGCTARTIAILVAGALLVGFPASSRAGSTNGIAGGVAGALVVTMVCAAVTSLANPGSDDDPYARRGWTLGASGTYAITTGESDLQSELQSVLGPTASLSLDDSFGMSGRAGYRCHEYLAAEVEVEWVDGFEGNISGSSTGSIDFEPLVVTSNAKGYFPIGRYQPYLLLGVGAMTAESSSNIPFVEDDGTDFAMRFGGGLDVYATEHIVATIGFDYVFPLGSVENLDYVSIGWGLEYRF